jgi:ribonuclease P protein component
MLKVSDSHNSLNEPAGRQPYAALQTETATSATSSDLDRLSSIQISGRFSSPELTPSHELRPEIEQALLPAQSRSGDGERVGPQPFQLLTMNSPSSVPQPMLSPTTSAATAIARHQEPTLVAASDLRLRKHADYQRAYKATRKQFSSSMSWFLALRSTLPPAPAFHTPGPCPRVGLTVGKVIGKAHERNLIKRRMREAVRHAIHELPEGVDLILHPKRSVMTMDFVKLEAEVLRIFRQAATQTGEMTARIAQAKPILGPEAVQNPGQKRSQERALKPETKPAQTQDPGESVTRS